MPKRFIEAFMTTMKTMLELLKTENTNAKNSKSNRSHDAATEQPKERVSAPLQHLIAPPLNAL